MCYKVRPQIIMKDNWPHKGQIFVVTAPSGTGKTTLINMIRERVKGIGYSVSHTTRKSRQGEVNGLHYHFVDRADFEAMIEAHEFVEWAVVYDQLYGTSTSSIRRGLSSGRDLLIDLDIQGAQAIKTKFPESHSIFVLPPSMEILRQRLAGRSTEDKKSLDLRTKKAVEEIRRCKEYDFIVINDDINKAVGEIEAIITAQRACARKRLPLVQTLFDGHRRGRC